VHITGCNQGACPLRLLRTIRTLTTKGRSSLFVEEVPEMVLGFGPPLRQTRDGAYISSHP